MTRSGDSRCLPEGELQVVRKALVLCAGEATRLRPLTFSKPKHLLPVAGQPILAWVLQAVRDAGITEVGIIVGAHAEPIREYAGAGDPWDLKLEHIRQDRPLGIADAVSKGQEYVGDEPFLVYLGDNLLEHGVADFVGDLATSDWDAAILLKRVHEPQRFGIAEVDGDRVLRVVEKPKQPASDLAIVGVYAFRASVFDAIERLEPSIKGELEITDAIQLLIEDGLTVRWRNVDGLWEDAGEPTALLRTSSEWLAQCDLTVAEGTTQDCQIHGPVGVEAGARVTNSQLIGPCRIGPNSVIRDSTIGPDVTVGEACEIIGTKLRNCIVQHSSKIRELPAGLVDSVLGEQVTIHGPADGLARVPLSVLLGDMAHVKAR